MRESLPPSSSPSRAEKPKQNPFEPTPQHEGLTATEKQDIDAALLALEASGPDTEDPAAHTLGTQAEGIILAYGARAKEYLADKLREGKISEDDYQYLESSWWDDAYDDGNDPFYQNFLEAPSGSMPEMASQGAKAYENLLEMLVRLESRLKTSAPPPEKEERPGERLFFRYPDSQKELYQYCKAIAQYLKDENVPNLIIMDRSSRPLYVGVREYWQSRFPDQRMPNMYFMNPKGFKAREDQTPEDISEIIEDCEWKGDAFEHSSQVRSKKQILDEIERTYSRLVKEKDKPVLIFDTCLHTGRTLKPVRDILQESGFTDLRVGSVNPAERGSVVETDFFITRRHPEKGCYPFDKDRLVEKTFDHVYSKRSTGAFKRDTALRLRDEIRQIMREQLEADTK